MMGRQPGHQLDVASFYGTVSSSSSNEAEDDGDSQHDNASGHRRWRRRRVASPKKVIRDSSSVPGAQKGDHLQGDHPASKSNCPLRAPELADRLLHSGSYQFGSDRCQVGAFAIISNGQQADESSLDSRRAGKTRWSKLRPVRLGGGCSSGRLRNGEEMKIRALNNKEQPDTVRLSISSKLERASLLRTTIVLLIAYELYLSCLVNITTITTKTSEQRMLASELCQLDDDLASSSRSHRCPPIDDAYDGATVIRPTKTSLQLITSCSAAQVPAPTSTLTSLSNLSLSEGPVNSSSLTTTTTTAPAEPTTTTNDTKQIESQTTTRSPIIITETDKTPYGWVQITMTAHPPAGSLTSASAPSRDAASPGTETGAHRPPPRSHNHNHHHHRQPLAAAPPSSPNVLCNSRCNCVILELFTPPPQADKQVSQAGDSPIMIANSTPADTSPTSSTLIDKQVVDEPGKTLGAGYNQRGETEKALIAFSEDYSLDNEQPTGTHSGTGNGPAEDGSGADSEPVATGNDRATSRPAGAVDRSASTDSRRQNSSTTQPIISQRPTTATSKSSNNASREDKTGTPSDLHVAVGVDGAIGGSLSLGRSSSQQQLAGAGGLASWFLHATQSAAAKSQSPQELPFALATAPDTGAEPQSQFFSLHSAPHAGRETTNGAQLYAQSLYSSQAPKLSYHAHSPYLAVGSGAAMAEMPVQPAPSPASHYLRSVGHRRLLAAVQSAASPASMLSQVPATSSLQRLVPLNRLDWSGQLALTAGEAPAQPSNGVDRIAGINYNIEAALASSTGGPAASERQPQVTSERPQQQQQQQLLESSKLLADKLEQMLLKIERNQIQSLVLSQNAIQFELWSELYALLASPMRQHLFHLDLSHNSLSKLGITFTGYLEHHLAVHKSWPHGGGGGTGYGTYPSGANRPASSSSNSSENEISTKPAATNQRPMPAVRHSTLFSSGKLFTLMQDRLTRANSSLALSNMSNAPNNASANSNSTTSPPINLLHQLSVLRALDLSHNKLKWLINDQFKALKHIQTIRLDHNRIRSVHQHTFSGLESLRFLNLNYNRLHVIYIEQFQTNHNLLALMLRSNYLSYLRGGSFASLANLKRLDLSQNRFTILSNNAFIGLESLELLNLSANQMVHAPSASLHPLTSLQKLDLSGNQIAQLAPGTFFHLLIDELWLDNNEQLVSIDRGAFWDLPHLRRLHMSSNPLLMDINSQAFVATQNLQQIDTDDCPSLDGGTRQMLDNITMAATSRLLRSSDAASLSAQNQTGSTSKGLDEMSGMVADFLPQAGSPLNLVDNQRLTADRQMRKGLPLSGHSNETRPTGGPMEVANERMKYIYYIGAVTMLVVALKLVFKYTSTSHYLDARRRRRRVYGADHSETGFSSASSSCLDDPGNFSMSSSGVLGGVGTSFHLSERPDKRLFPPDARYPLTQSYWSLPRVRRSEGDISGASFQPVVADQHLAGLSTIGSLMMSQSLSQLDAILSSTNNYQATAASQQQQPPPPPPSDAISANELQLVIGVNQESATADQQQQQQSVQLQHHLLPRSPCSCPDCPQPAQSVAEDPAGATPPCCVSGGALEEQVVHQTMDPAVAVVGGEQEQQAAANSGVQSPQTYDLIHSQLIAAGFDYGHANCAHFYQSLGPALQLADITANFDHY